MIECSVKIEEFISCEILIEVGILGHKAYFLSYILIIDTPSEDGDISERRSHDPEDTLHRSGLPCTIGSEKSEYFSLCERK